MTARTKIYIRLLDEAVDCWRPVEAEPRGAAYLVIGPTPSDEQWEFPAGSLVICQQTQFSEGETVLAANGLASTD